MSVDATKRYDDIVKAIEAGSTNAELLEMASSYAFSREDLFDVIRILLKRPDLSKYYLSRVEKSFCKCGSRLYVLMPRDMKEWSENPSMPTYGLCMRCERNVIVGKHGEVLAESQPEAEWRDDPELLNRDNI